MIEKTISQIGKHFSNHLETVILSFFRGKFDELVSTIKQSTKRLATICEVLINNSREVSKNLNLIYHSIGTLSNFQERESQNITEILKEVLLKQEALVDIITSQNEFLKIQLNRYNTNPQALNEEIVKALKSIDNTIKNESTTPNMFSRKRIHSAIDDTFQYICSNMKSSIFIMDSRHKLLQKAMEKVNINGSFVEFGVYGGDTINYIAALHPGKKIFGFDSFKGLPEDWSSGHSSIHNPDFFEKRRFQTPIPNVKQNVELIEGWFKDTIPKWMDENKDVIAFLFVDCDLYSSTKTILSLLDNRIVPGTIIVFDEYFGYFEWREGEYKAFQEFVQKKNIKYNYLYYRYDQVAVQIEKNGN